MSKKERRKGIAGVVFTSAWYILIALAVLFVINLLPWAPMHWWNPFDGKRLTEKEVAATAKEVTVKWPAKTLKAVTHEDAGKLKPGTKVTLLGILVKNIHEREVFNYGDKVQYLVQLPDGNRVLANLPEAAVVFRPVVKATGDTVAVKSVNKNKDGSYTFKASNGKTYKRSELDFYRYSLPMYYENSMLLPEGKNASTDKIQHFITHYTLHILPNGFYKEKPLAPTFIGSRGLAKPVARGFAGLFDAVLMLLFILLINLLVSKAMVHIPFFHNWFQIGIGTLLTAVLLLAYFAFVSGLSVNIILLVLGFFYVKEGIQISVKYERCKYCRHGGKMEDLGLTEHVTHQISEGWEHFTGTETEGTGWVEVVKVDGVEKSRRELTSSRRVESDQYVKRWCETWEWHLKCNHCGKLTVEKYRQDHFKVLDVQNEKKGGWRKDL